ncbi:hypothetical protein H072_8906 [Dactylellina haptotyla CBS 200.50]|uniref:Autophagy-related protein 29 n=1 Tax=Dactylellina haptotyla (strain CBS 200.50) TaxID=1284197 RepID=S8A3W4_DACHA|nr:hypothetical protein H072_8906 [Dactylellina haptotyla CBS 200.50]
MASNRQFVPTAAGLAMPSGLHPAARRTTPSAGAPPDQSPDVRYTVYLRLPFPRNGFVDPPPVDWDASKERSLWKVISKHRNSELDWNLLAEHYNVSAPFLLQQVAWLYERELSQVRAQLRRVGTVSTPLTTPGTPQPGATGQRALAGAETSRPNSAIASRPLGTPMSRTSSRNVSHPPVSPISQDKAAMAAAAIAPSATFATPMSRTTSASTARAPPTQSSQSFPATPTLGNLDSFPPQPRRTPKASGGNATATSPTVLRRSPSPSSSTSSSRSSDESSSVDNDGLYKRRNFRKFGTSSRIVRQSKEEEADDEESPAFLPWSEGAGDGTNSAAAEGAQAAVTVPPPTSKQRRPRPPATGGYEPDRGQNTSGGTIKRGLQQINIQPYNPISDSGASTPASQSSPRGRVNAKPHGNQSSPSMGSSFSDLSEPIDTTSSSFSPDSYVFLVLFSIPILR